MLSIVWVAFSFVCDDELADPAWFAICSIAAWDLPACLLSDKSSHGDIVQSLVGTIYDPFTSLPYLLVEDYVEMLHAYSEFVEVFLIICPENWAWLL